MTQTTAYDDPSDQPTVDTSGPPSSAPTHSASRDAIANAMLRHMGEEAEGSPTAPASTRGDGPETDDRGPGDASTPGVNPGDGSPDSRRGRGLQRTVDQVVQELEQIKARIGGEQQSSPPPAPEAEYLAPLDAAVETARQAIADLRGSDDDWADLQSRVVDGLSFEDAERYRRMQAARHAEKQWTELSDATANKAFAHKQLQFWKQVADAYMAVGQEQGIDPEYVLKHPNMGEIFSHVYQAGRAQLSDENEDLKAEVADLRRQLARNAPTLARGGRSTAGLTDRPDPRTAGPQEMLTAGIRQREGAKK